MWSLGEWLCSRPSGAALVRWARKSWPADVGAWAVTHAMEDVSAIAFKGRPRVRACVYVRVCVGVCLRVYTCVRVCCVCVCVCV
jgi:hypothetical protein